MPILDEGILKIFSTLLISISAQEISAKLLCNLISTNFLNFLCKYNHTLVRCSKYSTVLQRSYSRLFRNYVTKEIGLHVQIHEILPRDNFETYYGK